MSAVRFGSKLILNRPKSEVWSIMSDVYVLSNKEGWSKM